MRGAGDDGAGDVFFAAVGEGFADTGHGVEFGDFLADPSVALDADGGPVEGFSGEFFETGFGRPGVEVGADALDVFFEGEVVSVFEEDVSHRLVDGPFGVEDDSVEVEEEGAGFHWREGGWGKVIWPTTKSTKGTKLGWAGGFWGLVEGLWLLMVSRRAAKQRRDLGAEGCNRA